MGRRQVSDPRSPTSRRGRRGCRPPEATIEPGLRLVGGDEVGELGISPRTRHELIGDLVTSETVTGRTRWGRSPGRVYQGRVWPGGTNPQVSGSDLSGFPQTGDAPSRRDRRSPQGRDTCSPRLGAAAEAVVDGTSHVRALEGIGFQSPRGGTGNEGVDGIGSCRPAGPSSTAMRRPPRRRLPVSS